MPKHFGGSPEWTPLYWRCRLYLETKVTITVKTTHLASSLIAFLLLPTGSSSLEVRQAASIVGELRVDLTPGVYPPNEGPKYDLVTANTQYTLRMMDHTGRWKGKDTVTGGIRLGLDNGAPALIFGDPDGCILRIANYDQTVGSSPTRYRLTDGHLASGAPCPSLDNTGKKRWTGVLNLQADPNTGDLQMDLVLDAASTSGRQEQQLSLLGISVPNRNPMSVYRAKAAQAAQNQANQARLAELDAKGRSGDVKAQVELLEAYDEGKLGPKNPQQAAAWAQVAADKGDAYAQRRLGYFYEQGLGVKQSDIAAVYWVRKSAEQGDPISQNDLGLHYEHGSGVKQDSGQAVFWLRKAAAQQLAEADWNLGLHYEFGAGVKIDITAAREWYERSISHHGEAEGQVRRLDGICDALKSRVEAAQQPPQPSNAKEQFFLGEAYLRGCGVPLDLRQASFWFSESAAQGQREAVEHLQAMAGHGTIPDERNPSIAFNTLLDLGNAHLRKTIPATFSTPSSAPCWMAGDGGNGRFVVPC